MPMGPTLKRLTRSIHASVCAADSGGANARDKCALRYIAVGNADGLGSCGVLPMRAYGIIAWARCNQLRGVTCER